MDEETKNNILQHVPDEQREAVTQYLNTWETEYKSVNDKYSNWKSFEDQGISPEIANQAVTIRKALEENPQKVYETLHKHFGQQSKEDEGQPSKEDDEFKITPEQFKAIEQRTDTLAQLMIKEREQKEQERLQEQQSKELDKELNGLRKKHGDFPEDEIIMRMAHLNLSAEDALKAYRDHINEVVGSRPAAFPVMGSGGNNLPSHSPPDPTKMSKKDIRDYVTQTLAHAAREGN